MRFNRFQSKKQKKNQGLPENKNGDTGAKATIEKGNIENNIYSEI